MRRPWVLPFPCAFLAPHRRGVARQRVWLRARTIWSSRRYVIHSKYRPAGTGPSPRLPFSTTPITSFVRSPARSSRPPVRWYIAIYLSRSYIALYGCTVISPPLSLPSRTQEVSRAPAPSCRPHYLTLPIRFPGSAPSPSVVHTRPRFRHRLSRSLIVSLSLFSFWPVYRIVVYMPLVMRPVQTPPPWATLRRNVQTRWSGTAARGLGRGERSLP